jgi:alpha 1,3-mannosyltransferase
MTLHAQIARGGHGIVIAAGDEQARHALTLIPTLRRLGCNLPIQVTYFGDGGLTEDYRAALERLPGVVTRDLIPMIADTECGSEERWARALSWSA